MNEFLEKEILRKLCDILSHNPGVHSSKLAEMLKIHISEVEQHLRVLEKQGVLLCSKKQGYAQYYINEKGITARQKRTLEVRRSIYGLLSQNPGLHLSRVANLLKMSIPLTDYHLLSMERNQEISAVKDERGYYKRYYINTGERVSGSEAQVLELLSKKTPLQIVLILLQYPILQHKDILKYVDVSSSTLSYYLSQLVQQQIVEMRSIGTEKGYTLKDKKTLVRILKKHEFHIEIHLVMDRFKDLWGGFHYPG